MTPPKYLSYKTSGERWLPSIPATWNLRPLKSLATLNPSSNEVVRARAQDEVSFLPMESIGEDGSIVLDQLRPVRDVQTGYSFFADGDVAFAKVTPCFENGKGALMRGLIGGVGFGTTELTVLRPEGATDPRYLYYLTQERRFQQLGRAAMTGAGGLKRVPERFTASFPVAAPSPQEQSAIANYLDRETAQIDELIAKQDALIDLLCERRKAVIIQSVLKGLDPTAQMRESGVTWLGDIPSDWSAGNIRRFAHMKTGHTPSRSIPEYWIDTEIPWFTLADVWQLRDGRQWYLDSTKAHISELGLANSAAELLPAGTVVLSRTASVGFSGIMPIPMATSQDYWNWVCTKSLTPEYLLLVFRAMQDHLRGLMAGSTHKTIYQTDAASLTIPVPPIDVQHAIVRHLKGDLSRTDNLIDKANDVTALLRERRSALITAAVTGAIDVRGAA